MVRILIRSATQALIIDTSVWIDLFDGDLIHAIFDLPDEFAMTDLAFIELVDPNRRNQLRSAGLQIATLSGVQILELMYLIEQHPKVSRADISGLLAARDKSSISVNIWLTKKNKIFVLTRCTLHNIVATLYKAFTTKASKEQLAKSVAIKDTNAG